LYNFLKKFSTFLELFLLFCVIIYELNLRRNLFMKKKIFAILLTGAMLANVAGVFAAEKGGFYVDGQAVSTTVVEDNKIMVPVRDAAQALGFEVEWTAQSKTVTLTKGAVYITFAIGNDGYTFAKTAPMPLGRAAEIKDGVTFVPVELFTELMELNASIDGGDVNIITVTELKGSGVVKELSDSTITFEDSEIGEVLLHIGDDTVLTDSEGNTLELGDIAVGSELDVVYGDAMMESLPPQNVPKSIALKAAANVESLTIIGTVEENEDGFIHVVSDDKEAQYAEVVLVLTDETIGDGLDAKVGDKVEATFSPIMTRSIPPQANVFTVNVVK
jgi:hypothetical protein